ncbi:MAG: type II secretion system protein GspC [Myxococcota bacterium]
MNPNLMGGILAAATLVSAGSAVGINQVIATQLAPDGVAEETEAGPGGDAPEPRVAAARTSRSRATRVLTAEEYLNGIMKRNLFDVEIIAKWSAPAPKSESGEQETPLRVRLLGTVVANDPQFSSALIASEDDPYSKGYSIGDKLADRTIVEIIKGKVKLERIDGAFEWLSIDDEEGKRVTATTTPQDSDSDGDEGIQQTGDNRFAVSRDLFDKYINDMESITKLGRALLHRGPDGSFDGYRLAAIRRNTLADQLGIKNGDIIHAVNGEPLTSLQAAMNAYNTMQTQSNFCFEITRRRKPVELCYDVR